MKKLNIDKIYEILKKEVKNYDVPVVDLIEMQTRDPFKVLVTTILSARTQDKATTKAAKKLFEVVKNVDDLKKINIKKLQKIIFPVGFYKNKAKFLKELPKVLKEKFNGKIPKTVEELVKLPGVGRKTANLVVAVAFKKPAVCVDTHVHKIVNRLGYVSTKTPHETEIELRKKFPKRYWKTFNSIFVAFGQNTCRPISPYCSRCPVKNLCNKIGVKNSR